MTSDLSIFAARLRDFISICVDESPLVSSEPDPAWLTHHDAEFNGMALVLFALQFQRNAIYRKFCEARSIAPDSLTHWTQIPAVPAAAFKELDLTCLPPEERTTVFHSSGTTEQRPSRHFHSAESLAIYEASLWPWFREHLLPNSTPDTSHLTPDTPHLAPDTPQLALLVPPAAQAPRSSLVHMFEVVRQRLGAPASAFNAQVSADGSWALNFDHALAALREAVNGTRPLLLGGTAFSFVQLLDHLAELNLNFTLPSGSRVMETGGYKGRSRTLPKAELHSLITERLGVPSSHIVSEYGMSELSSQAYDLKVSGARCQVSGGRCFRFPLWARGRVISPESGREAGEGETGLLRIFDLANVFSVMAIQTEDLAVRRSDGFELVGRAELSEPRGCSLMIANSR